jgi:hypothetical protein
MSSAGDAIGLAIIGAQQTATLAMIAGTKKGQVVDGVQLQLARAKAEGNVISQAIQVAVAGRPRIFVGTSPAPNPTQFQEGDIYLLREA